MMLGFALVPCTHQHIYLLQLLLDDLHSLIVHLQYVILNHIVLLNKYRLEVIMSISSLKEQACRYQCEVLCLVVSRLQLAE